MSPVSPCHMGIACRSISTSHQSFHQGTDDCTICVPATDMQVVDPSPQPSRPPYSSMHYCRAWQWPPRRTAASQPCGQAQSSSSRYATVFVLQQGARLDALCNLAVHCTVLSYHSMHTDLLCPLSQHSKLPSMSWCRLALPRFSCCIWNPPTLLDCRGSLRLGPHPTS